MKIFDINGVWYKNMSVFPMPDGNNKVVYPSQELIKIEETDWVKSQPVMVKQPSPEAIVEKLPAKVAASAKPVR